MVRISRSIRGAKGGALIALLVFAASGAARADGKPAGRAAEAPPSAEAQAARAFGEGRRAFDAGDYRHAAESFEAAYKDKPHHDPLWNAARAWQRAGEAARAANLYERYLREAPPNARDRNSAQATLRDLAAKLGELEIHADGFDDVRVDGEPVGAMRVHVNPGAHVVQGKKGDASVRQTQSVDPGEVVSVALVESTDALPAGARDPNAPRDADGAHAARGRGWSPVIFAVGAGLTVVAAGATIVSGVDTLGQKEAFDASRTPDNLDAGRAKELRTNVLLGVTAGLAAVTATTAFFFTDWKGSGEKSDQRAGLGVGLGNVVLRGTF